MHIGFLLRCFLLFSPVLSLRKYPGIDAPHAIAVMKGDEFQCQGINIGGQVVLTVGYCVKANETYEILAGFTTANGNLLQANYRITSCFVYFFENFNDTSLERNMALIALNGTIPLSTGSAPAVLDFCFARVDTKSCFLFFWSKTDNAHRAYTLQVELGRGMCKSNTILLGFTTSEKNFCGRTRVCLPDAVGASLTCKGIAVGLVIKSACSQSRDRTEFVFVSLKKMESMMQGEVEKMALEMAEQNIIPSGDLHNRRVSFANNVEVWSHYQKRALNSGVSIHLFVNVFILLLLTF